MGNDNNSLLDELPYEAKVLLAKITFDKRQINRLAKTYTINLDVLFAEEILERVSEKYSKKYGQIIKDRQVEDALYFHCAEAYGYGYKDALTRYSDIIRQEIVKAAKELSGKAIKAIKGKDE